MANAIAWLKSGEEYTFEDMTTSEILDYIIEDYKGTCHSMVEDDYDWLDLNGQLEAFDNGVFECAWCGWWCGDDSYSPNDHDTETVCDECSPYE